MKAAIYSEFGGPIRIESVPDPAPHDDGAVIRVKATGICLSDWHGWQGHDSLVKLPNVPGHEFAGVIEAVGNNVEQWKAGDRVTIPFVAGCGHCPECLSGNQQVCEDQYQPGFSGWGSFAEYVAIRYADTNLVRLPEEIDDTTAASLGCRFATSYRAVTLQGAVQPGEWVAVHGCGGVGLSAIMIATALGARVIAVDLTKQKVEYAEKLGAVAGVSLEDDDDPLEAIRSLTGGGAHVSIDAIGHPTACFNSVSCLRTRGRHIQVGLLVGDDSAARIPMERVIAGELRILGSHGLQAHYYPEMLGLITSGRLEPGRLVQNTVGLDEGVNTLEGMHDFTGDGISVIDRF